MVKPFHDFRNVPVGYVLKTAAFGKVLPDQAVGVLVQATLPGTIVMRKIDADLKLFGGRLVSCELLAVVGGNGQRLVQVKLQQRNGGFRDNLGMLAADFFDQGELGYPVHDGH